MGVRISNLKHPINTKTVEPEVESALSHSRIAKLDLVYEEFKKKLLNDCLKSLPVSCMELKKYFTISTLEYKEKLRKELEKSNFAQQHIQNMLQFLELKIKAVEGYFFHVNDMISLKVVHDTKFWALENRFNERVEATQVLVSYFKKAKGSYLWQGYKELNELLRMDKESAWHAISMQYEESLRRLNSMYEVLLSSKMIDEEIYAATIEKIPEFNGN